MVRPINTLGDVRNCGFSLIAVCRNIVCRRRQLLDLDALIDLIGSMTPMLPHRGQPHFSERLKCARCQQAGAYVWIEMPYDPKPLIEGMGYKVNNWDETTDGLIGTVAYVGHENVAHFAFDGAVSAYPKRRITLQQGMRIIRDSRFRVMQGGKLG